MRPLRTSLAAAGILGTSFLLALGLISGCGGASIKVDLNTIAAISAPTNALRVNQALQLNSSYLAAGLPMNFSVNGIPGGNATVGTVSSSGVYTAPAAVPTPFTVQITSSIAKYPNATPGSIAVQVWNPIPLLSSANPGAFSEGATTVQRERLAVCVWCSQISWNGASVPTTYVSSTELVAQIAAPTPEPIR